MICTVDRSFRLVKLKEGTCLEDWRVLSWSEIHFGCRRLSIIFSLDNQPRMDSKISRRLQLTINLAIMTRYYVSMEFENSNPGVEGIIEVIWAAGRGSEDLFRPCAGRRMRRDLGGEALLELSSGSCEKNKANEKERCQRSQAGPTVTDAT